MTALGLPTLRMLDGQPGDGESQKLRIWLCLGRTDMRCGFDRLAALAQQVTGHDPFCGHLFVFRNRSGDRLKILYWDSAPGGFVLWYKRLEEGQFKFPKLPPGDRPPASLPLRPSELAMLLDGIDLSSVRRSKRYRRSAR